MSFQIYVIGFVVMFFVAFGVAWFLNKLADRKLIKKYNPDDNKSRQGSLPKGTRQLKTSDDVTGRTETVGEQRGTVQTGSLVPSKEDRKRSRNPFKRRQ